MKNPHEFLLPLKPCPWCKKTPEMFIPIEGMQNTNGTWTWHIFCKTAECKMKPKSPYVSIRNTVKKSPEYIRRKLLELILKWNEGNDLEAYEGKLVDIMKIVKEGI